MLNIIWETYFAVNERLSQGFLEEKISPRQTLTSKEKSSIYSFKSRCKNIHNAIAVILNIYLESVYQIPCECDDFVERAIACCYSSCDFWWCS